MKPFADTRRLTLARRLASGLPAWAVARASNIPDADLEALVVESGFAELVNAMAELMALDDRLLADIGLSRGQIPAAVGSARIGWLRDEVDSLVRPFRLWQRSIEATRALHSLDDRALADAGMLRSEIGWVAAELAERSLTPANSNRLPRAA